jgi:long-chain fatty acid transport protein
VTHDDLNGNGPYTITSRTQGFVNPEIAVAQDLRSLGVPGTLGLGLAGLSGMGAEYRGLAPAGSFANDFSTELLVLGLNLGLGLELTDQLSVGAGLTLGTGFEQLGLVSKTAMVNAYALRGNFGVDYKVNSCNTVGAFYQTDLGFNFPNAFQVPSAPDTYRDVQLDQPQTVGIGIANRKFMDGNLLLAADVYYKLWENADFYRDIFVNQWVFAVGTQLTHEKMKYRLGYSYNTNPINHSVGNSLDGQPILQNQIQFLQASETAVINQHRLTAGIGRQDFLIQGVDLDLFAGGLFPASDEFGAHTSATVALYYLGMGLTWRYGATACCHGDDDPCTKLLLGER